MPACLWNASRPAGTTSRHACLRMFTPADACRAQVQETSEMQADVQASAGLMSDPADIETRQCCSESYEGDVSGCRPGVSTPARAFAALGSVMITGMMQSALVAAWRRINNAQCRRQHQTQSSGCRLDASLFRGGTRRRDATSLSILSIISSFPAVLPCGLPASGWPAGPRLLISVPTTALSLTMLLTVFELYVYPTAEEH